MALKAFLFTVCSFVFFASISTANTKEKFDLEMWSRKQGNYTNKQTYKKENLFKVAFSSIKPVLVKTYDIQYEKELIYKGVSLSTLLDTFKKSKNEDTAILHFSNGMIVPLDLANRIREKILIATSFKEKKSDKVWKTKFPNLEKKDNYRYFKDPNPTTFDTNKIVIKLPKKALFFKGEKGKLIERFTPWKHVSSLVGIEFVNKKAYDYQFSVKGNEKNDLGQSVFKSRCQYCHGVHETGASFGWDYAGPIKISEKRDKKSLHLFVKYPKAESFEMGLKMPNQIDIKKKDTEALWEWIDLISKAKLNDYNIK